MPVPIEVDMEIVRREYLQEALSITAIAKRHGYSVNTLRRRLQAAGIEVFKERQFGGRKGTGLYPQLADREWLAEQLATKPALQIANELGTTSGNVSDFMKRHGLREAANVSDAVKTGIMKRIHERKFPVREDHPNWSGGTHMQNGYLKVLMPGHPSADSRGYVLEHRKVMEEHLGRALKPDEIVHHINYDKLDNRIENLQLMENQQEHMQLHNTVRSLKAKIASKDARIAELEKQLQEKK